VHFRLPKPLHGWRAFAGEVGIIVIGVLMALGAEQVVDDWQWHRKVGAVRKALMSELGNDRARWEFDVQDGHCVVRQLDSLNAWAREGAKVSEPAHEALGATSNLFLMHSANWTLANGSQTLDHFPLDEQLALATLYDGIAHRQKDISDAIDLKEKVDTETPLVADPQDRRELLDSIGALKGKLKALLDNENYMRRHFDALHVQPDRSDFAADVEEQGCF
jgi:hypothetical protein